MLRTAVRERGVPFKEALNQAIRAGLSTGAKRPQRRFVQRTFALGSEQNFCWEKVLAAADAIEDQALARKLPLRK